MPICSVKKLNKRQCRNKCTNKVCDYHRYHPYLNGPTLLQYRMNANAQKRKRTNMTQTFTPFKRVRFTHEMSEKSKSSFSPFVLNLWRTFVLLFVVGVALNYNTISNYAKVSFDFLENKTNELMIQMVDFSQYYPYVYSYVMDYYTRIQLLTREHSINLLM